MDEPREIQSKQSVQVSTPSWKTDGLCLLILLLLATSIRGWLLFHTEVTSRDSIGFERYAWELEHKKWKEAVRSNIHHPLYPLTVLAVSVPVQHFLGGSDLEVWQLSAQLASGLAGILLVVPMFFLGKGLFDRRVGFWSAAIFQCLPVGARVMSDALSESVFLLASATALLLALRGFSKTQHQHSEPQGHAHWCVFGLRVSDFGFIGCGLFSGLAYLTRPEGILIVIAVAMVFVGRWIFVDQQVPWRRKLQQLWALALATAVVAGPYIAIIHGFSNKTTTRELLRSKTGNSKSENEEMFSFRNHLGVRNLSIQSSVQPLLSNFGFQNSDFELLASDFGSGFPSFAIWWPDGKVSDLRGHLVWSAYALASEISKGFFYVAWIPVLAGLIAFRGLLRNWAGHTAMVVLCLLQCLALLRVGMVAGYVADRHVLIIVMSGLYWGVAAVYLLAKHFRRTNAEQSMAYPVAGILFLALAGAALPKTLEPLHTNRAGHHAVGLWLAKHSTPADELDDPFCWAAHYAGRTFLRESQTPSPQAMQRYRYVVLDCRPDHHDQYRHASVPPDELISAGGKVVYHWPEKVPEKDASIVLYAVPLLDKK
jgi:4-amino-4-deoxy-L-arabinose transferase-like glycosyltransferase